MSMLCFTRVTDLYRFYFNDWCLRQDTGRPDIQYREEADGDWLNHQAELVETLRQHGFLGAQEDLLSE